MEDGELGPSLEKAASLAQLILLLGQFITVYFTSIGLPVFVVIGNEEWINTFLNLIGDGSKLMVV
jgi:hypothetical protein